MCVMCHSEERFPRVCRVHAMWSPIVLAHPSRSRSPVCLCACVPVCLQNMELTVQQCNNASAEIAAAHYPFVRLAQVKMAGSVTTPQADAVFSIPWTPVTPMAVPTFSALCYYFGREMFARLGGKTPVGLVEAAVGGTYIQSFSTPQANAACNNTGRKPPGWVPCPPTKPGQPPYSPWGGSNLPSALWNSMVHPLVYLRFKLAVWDQGEENLATGEASVYTCLQDGLVQAWRHYWGDELSFHLVQLPSFNYSEYLWIYKSPLGEMRLSQQATASDLPGVTRTVTVDLADLKSPYTSVHNRQKQAVARRVTLNVLANAYGQRLVPTHGSLTSRLRYSVQVVVRDMLTSFPHVFLQAAQHGPGRVEDGDHGWSAAARPASPGAQRTPWGWDIQRVG